MGITVVYSPTTRARRSPCRPHRRFQRRHRAADRQAERTVRAPREQLRRQLHRREQLLAGTVENIEKGYCRVALASGGSSWPRRPTWPAQAPPLSVDAAGADLHPNGRGGQRRPTACRPRCRTPLPRDHALAMLRSPATRSSWSSLAGARGGLSHGQSVSITFRPEDCLALDPV